MTFLTEDFVHEASIGPESGITYMGREVVRHAFKKMHVHHPDGETRGGPVFICSNKGVMEWTSHWTAPEGQVIEQRGCSVYEFDEDHIYRKNAFRKT